MMDGDSAVEISPANIIIEDQRGVGTTPCHDLPRCCFDDCNGVRLVAIFEGTENGNEDADRTYVFVNGRRVVAENGDVGENCTKLAPGEEYAEITELKKLNGDIKAGEANVNGHRCFEDVDAVDGTAEVENGSGINGEDGNHIMEKTDLFVTEDFKVESEKLDPLEEVDVVYSSESEALRAPNLEDTFKADSSFEVVEKVPESGEEGTNDNGSIDCKQPLKKIEDQPGQLDSNSEMPNSDSQAVNDKKAACLTDSRGPEENTAELSDIVESSSEDSEFHGNADSLCDIKESSNITKQLHAETASEVAEEVPNLSSISDVEADNLYYCKKSLGHAANQHEQMEYSSDAAEKQHGSPSIGDGDDNIVGKCIELLEDIKVISAEVSEQVAENKKSEVVSDKANSEFSIGDGIEENTSRESKSYPIEVEKVEESSHISVNANLLENPELVKDDVNDDAVQGMGLVVMASETTLDQRRNMDGYQNLIIKPSACADPYGIDTTISKSHIDIDHMLETNPMPGPVSTVKEYDDSVDSNLDIKEQATASENMASSADHSSMSVESFECPITTEETLMALNSDVAERYLVMVDGASSAPLIDREPVAELVVDGDANIPSLEDTFSNADVTSSAVAEMGREGQDGPTVIDDTMTRICITELAETKICFGSINHEVLSSISIKCRSFKTKSSFNAAVKKTSPDLKSSPNDGNDESMSQGTGLGDAQSDEVSHVEGSTSMLAEAQILVSERERRFFNYIVKFPRYGEDLKEQMNNAQKQVDEKTRCRDAIQAEIQSIKATQRDYLVELEAASAEERSVRESLKSKRQEIDMVQYVVNKVKDAMSIDDIDHRIHSMEQKIEHETLPLKEEKQFLREIKQLTQFSEQLSSDMGKQYELKEALEQKEQTEERLKVMRKDVDLLRGSASRAEVVIKAVKKKLYECNDKLHELQEQFKAADAVRQEAYQGLKVLREQLRDKNKYFYKYKNDATISNEMGSKGDRDGVSGFCLKQVEEFMELWSNDVEFRSE